MSETSRKSTVARHDELGDAERSILSDVVRAIHTKLTRDTKVRSNRYIIAMAGRDAGPYHNVLAAPRGTRGARHAYSHEGDLV